MKVFTTLEESRQLIELGADAASTDWSYQQNDNNTETAIPCWTTEALLNLLPSPINKIYVLTIEKYEGYEGIEYDIQYSMDEGSGDTLFETSNQSLFEAVYDTVVWWLKYQKNKQHS